MTDSTPPDPPAGTGAGGRRLWVDVTGRFDLDEHELTLLVEAVRTVDNLDRLDEVVRRDGMVLGDRVHPALVEARQLRLVLARLIASLRLPEADDDEQHPQRPQRRGAARGVYASRRRYGVVPGGA